MTAGQLFLVGVPIGNWQDMTFRAVETLKSVDIIAAEDTRKAKKLLDHFSIQADRVISHHAANEHTSVKGLLDLLRQGKNIAFISDAGMPGISDPGHLLLREALQQGICIDVIPGVSAVTTALLQSGLPCEQFMFVGFLPRKHGERLRALNNLKDIKSTLIFYEAPHRLKEALADMCTLMPERQACLCRELTKTHEEMIRGSLADIQENMLSREEILGEITLVLHGAEEAAPDEETLDEAILQEITQGATGREIKKNLAEKFQCSGAVIYKRYLALKESTL